MLHICRLIHNALAKVRFKNILFDLGGVILDLDVSKTYQAFSALAGGIPPSAIKSIMGSSKLFYDYEKGALTDQEFRQEAKKMLAITCTDDICDNAWNMMLGDLPAKRLSLLNKLKLQYNTYLVSNTNQIHKNYFSNIENRTTQGLELDQFFTRVYYSHIVKMRKPDAEIFQLLLSQNRLIAEETIFLDDNATNLEAATKLGIQVYHVQNPEMIFTFFK